jgi:uncharacterized protein (TIGR00290 family)
MRMKEKILIGWSGGKDSSLAVWQLQQEARWELVALVSTITEGYERLSMHGVRVELIRQQAESLGLTLVESRIPLNASNVSYEAALTRTLEPFIEQGVRKMAFGDLFLADIRRYREELLARLGMEAVFPLWQRDTAALSRQFLRAGFRAVVVCVDPRQIAAEFCGREYDERFLEELPASADPCGERGEFHTFVYAGPIFRRPIPVRRGAIVQRDGFCFCDLLPARCD